MTGDHGDSSPSGSQRFAVGWIMVVASVWVIFAAERLLAYRLAGFGPAVLVVHGLGWATAITVTAFCVMTSWRRSKRSLALAAAALSLLSAAVISVVDWPSLHARIFYHQNRQDFATLVNEVRRGLHSGDEAGGSQLSEELAHLSDNEFVGAAADTPERFVLFVPAAAARGDVHRNGAGAVRGCAIGYLNPGVEMPPPVDKYPVCPDRTPLGDGWYWAD